MTGQLPDVAAFQRLFSAWEKSAAAMADSASRNPKALELGAGLMRAHLAWVKAVQVSLEAWAPLFRPDHAVGGE